MNIPRQHLILRIQTHKIRLRLKEIIAPARNEIQGDHLICGIVVQRLPTDRHSDELGVVPVLRVIFHFDATADLEEGCNWTSVSDVDACQDAFEGFPERLSGDGELDDGVAKGEGRQDFAARDVACVDGSADAAGVDKRKVDVVGVVFAIRKHGVGHEVSQETFLAPAGCLVKFYVCGAEDLGGEFFKGAAPGFDFGLQGGVLFGGVGEVDRGTVVGEDFAGGVIGYVDVANVFAPAVGGYDEDLVAVFVIDDSGVFAFGVFHVAEERVAMAADDEVEASGGFGKFLVLFIADVGESCDSGDVGGALDLVNGTLHGLHWLLVFGHLILL